ncbi:hypothetical protein FRC06_008688, partial [Ceratobasidium sp. 370]
PMHNLSQSSLGTPVVPYKADHRGSKYDYRMSASTMDTAQLHATTPLHEHQYLREHDHFDAPSSPGYVPQLGYNPHTPETSAPGTPYNGPAPGLGHDLEHEHPYPGHNRI